MKKVVGIIACITLLVVAIAAALGWFFKAVPIITDTKDIRVIVQLYDGTYIENYDKNELFRYLSSCKAHRILENRSKRIQGVELTISIYTESESTHIFIGNNNVITLGSSSFKYKIHNGEEVKTKLLDILNID